jgi:hypothetical protein
MSELLSVKRTAHKGTYKEVPKINWVSLSAQGFTNSEGGEPDWLAMYPIKAAKGANDDDLPVPEGIISPRQAAKLFYDGLHLFEQTEKNPKFMMDRLPEMSHKAYKRKQFQKQFMEGCKRVCCRLAKGLGFSPNCVAEDCFVVVILESAFGLGWRRIDSHLEGLPECANDRDFTKIQRICCSGEIQMLWRGADAVTAHQSKASKKPDAATSTNKSDITDPRNWFKGYDASKDHLLNHVL